jgi:hypothetical protein
MNGFVVFKAKSRGKIYGGSFFSLTCDFFLIKLVSANIC